MKIPDESHPQSTWCSSAFGSVSRSGTNLQARRLGPFVAPYWLFAWLTGELAPHAILAHALMAVAFIAAGALDEKTGVAALVLTVRQYRAARPRASARSRAAAQKHNSRLRRWGFLTRDDISSLHGFPRAFNFASAKTSNA